MYKILKRFDAKIGDIYKVLNNDNNFYIASNDVKKFNTARDAVKYITDNKLSSAHFQQI